MRKNHLLTLSLITLLGTCNTIFSNDDTIIYNAHNETLNIDSKLFEHLLSKIINETNNLDKIQSLSPALVNCYKCSLTNKIYPLIDLHEAMPEILAAIDVWFDRLDKSPRPPANDTIVGSVLDCDVTELLLLMNRLLSIMNRCCTNIGYTFSVLEEISTTITECCESTLTTLSVNFRETFSILADLEATLTACCASIGSSNQPLTIFDEVRVSGRTDYINVKFQYGISNYDAIASTVSTGTVQPLNSMAIISSGNSASALARLQSKASLLYHAGHESNAYFSAGFPLGSSDNSTQWIGLFDETDGVAVGYNNTTFSILFRQFGISTTIPQSSFNLDPLDGSGPSGFILNTLNLNSFRIALGWLGTTPIKLQILDQNGSWITFHEFTQTNINQTPTFSNPILPIAAEVNKTAGGDNLAIATACWNGSVAGKQSRAGTRQFCIYTVLSTNIPITTEGRVINIRNDLTFQGKPNRMPVLVTSCCPTTNPIGDYQVFFALRTNATLNGAFYQKFYPDSVVSVAFNGNYVDGTGTLIDAHFFTGLPMNVPLSIILQPGDVLTVTARSQTSIVVSPLCALTWLEYF